MTWLADVASATDVTNNPWVNFGALGMMAGIGVWLIKREAARADRNEAAKDELNKGIRETVIPALTSHAHAIEQALEVLKDMRRGER